MISVDDLPLKEQCNQKLDNMNQNYQKYHIIEIQKFSRKKWEPTNLAGYYELLEFLSI